MPIANRYQVVLIITANHRKHCALYSAAKIPVKAMLGRSTISVNDYINIQIGDIVKLDSRVDDELDVYVGNIMKFRALPGAISDSYAVRVTSVVKEEQ